MRDSRGMRSLFKQESADRDSLCHGNDSVALLNFPPNIHRIKNLRECLVLYVFLKNNIINICLVDALPLQFFCIFKNLTALA